MRVTNRILVVTCLAIGLGTATAAEAGTVTYEWVGAAVSNAQSRHGVQGPVLADDFVPVVGGLVESITWWGSAPTTAGAPDQWEVTFHTNDPTGMNTVPNVPAQGPVDGGVSQHFPVVATQTDLGGGLWRYDAAWSPQDLTLTAGTDYWFSVANSNFGWFWANPVLGGPSVGSENFGGVVSTGVGPNGGPHYGPWNRALDGQRLEQDFAFRINIVPEPSTWALFGLGMLGLAGIARRRRKTAVVDEN